MVGLPLFVCYCVFAVLNDDGVPPVPGSDFWSHIAGPEWRAVAVYLGWLAFQGTLYLFLPGRLEDGPRLWDGRRLAYRLNGPVDNYRNRDIPIDAWTSSRPSRSAHRCGVYSSANRS